MNQEKISKFIREKREENKLTQQELADKLNLSVKTISKWECERGIPDIGSIQELAKVLKVSVVDLLNGEESKDPKPVIEYMEYKEKKTKKKMLITVLLSTLIVVLIILGTYFFNNFNRITMYELYGESEHFTYGTALVMDSNMKNMFLEGTIESKDVNISEDQIKYVAYYCGDDLIVGGSYHIENRDYYLEDNGYDEILDREKLNNIKKWKVLIKYEFNNETKEELIPLEVKEVMKNNKLFYKEKKTIGTEEPSKEEKETLENKAKKLDEYYLSKGYKKTQLDEWFYEYEKKYNNTTINIKLETTAANAKYEYSDNKYEMNFYVGAQYYSFHDRDYKIFIYYWRKDNYLACYEGETKIECPSYIKEDLDKIINVLDKEFKEIIPSKEHWKAKE